MMYHIMNDFKCTPALAEAALLRVAQGSLSIRFEWKRIWQVHFSICAPQLWHDSLCKACVCGTSLCAVAIQTPLLLWVLSQNLQILFLSSVLAWLVPLQFGLVWYVSPFSVIQISGGVLMIFRCLVITSSSRFNLRLVGLHSELESLSEDKLLDVDLDDDLDTLGDIALWLDVGKMDHRTFQK